MKTWIGTAATLMTLSLAAACGGSGSSANTATETSPTPTPASDSAPSAAQAETAFNDAVNAALKSGSGVSVQDASAQATLDGTLTADGIAFTFSNLVLAKKPFAATGTVSLTSGTHAATIAFAGSVNGDYAADGASAGTVHAKIPMENSFVQATASWALHQAWLHPAQATAAGAGACNVTVTDDGNGGVVLDGSCDVCGATVTFTMLDINPTAMTINGTIMIDDGNGNTATLTFNGTTVDVMVNGQDLGTFDLSQIFGGP